jgi:hypothetical protein
VPAWAGAEPVSPLPGCCGVPARLARLERLINGVLFMIV